MHRFTLSWIRLWSLQCSSYRQTSKQIRMLFASIKFKHHSGGVKVPINSFREHMQHVYGGEFENVDIVEWMSRASQAGIDPLITTYLESLLENSAPIVFPYLGEE